MDQTQAQNRQRYTLGELAAEVGGVTEGDPTLGITGVAGIREAHEGEISFVANQRYTRFIDDTQASALILAPGVGNGHLPVLRAEDPYIAYLKILRLFATAPSERYRPGQHPKAIVDPNANLGADVHLGAGCYIGPGAIVGDRTAILPGAVVMEGSQIGENCLIFPGVIIREGVKLGRQVVIHAGSVIGADGFGYAWDGNRHQKIPQIGGVEIGDEVEIGANVSIDRATTGMTRIGEGCRIDNLVQIAHNVQIGPNTIVVAQAGISGSTELGSNVTVAGQAGLAGHITIGDRVVIAAQAGVTKSVEAGVCVSGYPARPHDEAMRHLVALGKVPELLRRVNEMEREIASLKGESRKKEEGQD
jgi:UDP-3-O-[3-hydroxymyristoyl] glucosamine N-acyltransferase